MNFANIFSKNPQIPNFVKTRAVEAELFHADRQTDGYNEANNRLKTYAFLQAHFFQILIKLEFYQHIFEKSSNTKFRESSCSGSRVVPCGQTDRRADMTKLIIA